MENTPLYFLLQDFTQKILRYLSEIEKKSIFSKTAVSVVIGILFLIGLYLISLYSYPFFHAISEMFSVAVSFAIFMLIWNSRKYLSHSYFQLIGIAYLFVGMIDITHTLAYKGMNIFPGYDSNLPTQLWIAGRYLQSISLFLAPLVIKRSLNYKVIFTAYTVVGSALFVAIFSGVFPICYVEGVGLTLFKIISEYVISLILVGSGVLLFIKRKYFDRNVYRLILWSIVVTIGSEIAFTNYASVYGLSNLIGHYLKILSFYFIYQAIIATGLMKPYNLLFRDLKLSEDALRESEAKYQRLFENMTNGFAYHKIILDKDGRPVDFVFLEVNHAFEKLTGLRRRDIIGKSVREILPGIENDPADWIGTYGQVALYGREEKFEQYSEALKKWFSVSAYSPMKEHFVAVFEDITERKSIEQALRQSREDLDRAQEVGQIGWWRLDVQKNVLTWSDENHRIFGITKGIPLSYETFLSTVHPDDREYVDTRWKAGLRGEDYDIEHRIVSDGRVKWVREKAYLEFDSRGTLLGGFGITQDITERKKAEDELKKSKTELEFLVKERTAELLQKNKDLAEEIMVRSQTEEKLSVFNNLINQSSDAIFVVDFETAGLLEVNDTACTSLGYSRGELLNMRVIDFAETQPDLLRWKEYIREVKEKGQVLIEDRLRRKDGTMYYVEVSVKYITREERDYLVAIVRDITKRKETEYRIHVTNELLKLYTKKISRKEYLNAAVEVIHSWSNCRYAGIRVLSSDGYIPYEAHKGFSNEFLEAESMLCIQKDTCACIRVITEKPYPQDLNGITPQGSFSSCNLKKFMDRLTTEGKRQYRGGMYA